MLPRIIYIYIYISFFFHQIAKRHKLSSHPTHPIIELHFGKNNFYIKTGEQALFDVALSTVSTQLKDQSYETFDRDLKGGVAAVVFKFGGVTQKSNLISKICH